MPRKTQSNSSRTRALFRRGSKAPRSTVIASRPPQKPAIPRDRKDFPIVGVGASAGGLEAFIQLIKPLPPKPGMAFVLIQHLDPTHDSFLSELLARNTRIPVSQARQGERVQVDHVYVIPPNTNLSLVNGMLHLQPRTDQQRVHMPVDYFLRSLAREKSSRAIGIILSGTASDGTLGLKEIKGEGGITFAQTARSAKYDGMPRNAISAGCVDFVLPPEEIGRELARIGTHPYVARPLTDVTAELIPPGPDQLGKIFKLLLELSAVDFTHYKDSTVRRRIARRMLLHKVTLLADYLKLLLQNKGELEALYHDILINVTQFFRDPSTFEILKRRIFPRILHDRTDHGAIRLWVSGCSTGEEAYSLAISLVEFLEEKARHVPIQIFATDISTNGMAKARQGIYDKGIEHDVSPERLQRFFVKFDSGYQISKSIRDLCVFAKQNVTNDPPFSNLDLVSCRNVLIYMTSLLQKKVLSVFHYALQPHGYLLLGPSETIGGAADLFSLEDRRHKIYAKKGGRRPLEVGLRSTAARARAKPEVPAEEVGLLPAQDLQKEADHIVLNQFSPAGVIVDEHFEILQFRGRTSPFLEPAPGSPTVSLLKMAREDLHPSLHAALRRVKARRGPVRVEGAVLKVEGQTRGVRIEVIPLQRGSAKKGTHYLVLFDLLPPSPEVEQGLEKRGQAASRHARELARLRRELSESKTYLQSIIEEQDATNEELKSANEEIQSSNEELQSTNEELETAREELQSTNEELTTLNEEVQNRNVELTRANSDMSNLLVNVPIPIIMLGNDLRIRRFTPPAEKVLNLIPTDLGRPLGDLKPSLQLTDLDQWVREVIDTLKIKEREVQDDQGHWYLMRARPYRTLDHKIDGAVVAFLDIAEFKENQQKLKDARDYIGCLAGMLRQPILLLDNQFRVEFANQAFFKLLPVPQANVVGQDIFSIAQGRWNMQNLRSLLEKLTSVEGTEPETVQLADQDGKTYSLKGRRLPAELDLPPAIVLSIEEHTG